MSILFIVIVWKCKDTIILENNASFAEKKFIVSFLAVRPAGAHSRYRTSNISSREPILRRK